MAFVSYHLVFQRTYLLGTVAAIEMLSLSGSLENSDRWIADHGPWIGG